MGLNNFIFEIIYSRASKGKKEVKNECHYRRTKTAHLFCAKNLQKHHMSWNVIFEFTLEKDRFNAEFVGKVSNPERSSFTTIMYILINAHIVACFVTRHLSPWNS